MFIQSVSSAMSSIRFSGRSQHHKPVSNDTGFLEELNYRIFLPQDLRQHMKTHQINLIG